MLTNYVNDQQKALLQAALEENATLLISLKQVNTVEEANKKYIEYVESIAKLTNYESGFFGVDFYTLLTYMYDTVKQN